MPPPSGGWPPPEWVPPKRPIRNNSSRSSSSSRSRTRPSSAASPRPTAGKNRQPNNSPKSATRLEALGKNLLDGGDDRLIQAAADLQLANERITELEGSVTRLAAAVNDYLRQAVVSDPDARLRVETSLRELDAVLGLRQKPRPDVRTGSLQQARIVSLDQESGMLVLNIGESQGARIGMTFRLTRGQQPYGKAILADVRKGVCGVFVEALDHPADAPRPGDLAILETQAPAQ